MKPEGMQPSDGYFGFALPDTMLKLTEENNLKVVGHTLMASAVRKIPGSDLRP